MVLLKIQQVTPRAWGKTSLHAAHPSHVPSRSLRAELPGTSAQVPLGRSWARAPSAVPPCLPTDQNLFAAEPERSPRRPAVPPSFHCSQVSQEAERSERECDGSGRERGRLNSDSLSRGSQGLFWHLSLLALGRSSHLHHSGGFVKGQATPTILQHAWTLAPVAASTCQLKGRCDTYNAALWG